MSQIMSEIVRCSVCGKKSEHYTLVSTSTFGEPDLDLRPPEMERSTMDTWIQKCPYCGYVSGRLDNISKVNAPFLKTDEYKNCLGLVFRSKLAEMFYQQYLIQVVEKNVNEAFYAALHCAWVCDDVGDEKNSILCRKYALTELNKLIKKSKDENLLILRADILRRAGLFQRVIDEYEKSVFADDLLNQIARFQVAKAYEEDASCYTLSYVENDAQAKPAENFVNKVVSVFQVIRDFFRKTDENLEE